MEGDVDPSSVWNVITADQYPFWSPMQVSDFEDKISKIYVHAGSGLLKDGTILHIGCDAEPIDICGYMNDIRTGIIAKQFDNSRNAFRLAMARSKSEKMI